MLKLLITGIEKREVWGDVIVTENGGLKMDIIGGAIRIQILKLFWVDYKVYKFKENTTI
jgi:hypothetical protein